MGEIKDFRFFEPVEKTCGEVAARKRGMSTCRLIRSLKDSAQPPLVPYSASDRLNGQGKASPPSDLRALESTLLKAVNKAGLN